MKVNGQAEGMQLENLVAAPANTPAGRVYLDTLTGKAWLYNNVTTSWKELQYVSASSNTDLYDNGSSGKAITIDWNNGNNQKVTLSDNCVISFLNPVAGQTYNLQVKQLNFDTAAVGIYPFKYLFNMVDQADRRMGPQPNVRQAYQPQGVLASTESGYHSWFYSSNVQAAYANVGTSIANPQTLPATAGLCAEINPKGTNLVIGSSTSPYHYNYQLFDRGRQFEYGRQNAVTPTTLIAGSTSSMRYSPDGTMFAITTSATTFLSLYMVANNDTNTGGLYTALAGGNIPPGTAGYSCDWHPSGNFLAVGSQGTKFLSVYGVNQAGWSAIFSPTLATAGICYSVAFSPYGDYIAVGMNATPYLEVYPFTANFTTPVIGAKVAQYTGTIAGGVGTTALCNRAVSWRPQGDFIALGVQTTPFAYIVAFNRATGLLGAATAFAGTDIPAGTVNCMAFSPCGGFLAVGCNTTPFLHVYAFTAAGLTSGKLTIDAGGPTNAVNDIVWHPSGDTIFMATNTTPFMLGIPAPRVQKNYLRRNI